MNPVAKASQPPPAPEAAIPSPLHGLWLAGARIGWLVIALVTLGLSLYGVSASYEGLLQSAEENRRTFQELGLSSTTYALYLTALDLVIVLVHLVIAGVLFWRRSRDWMALFVAVALVTNGALLPLSLMYDAADLPLVTRFPMLTVLYLGLVSALGLLYLFPDGRFVPPWTRLPLLLWSALMFLAIFFPTTPFSLPSWPLWLQGLVLVAFSGGGAAAQLYRYIQASTPIQRQQTKLASLGLLAAAGGPFAYFFLFVILPSLSQPELPNFFYQLVGSAFFTFSLVLRLVASTVFALVGLLLPLSLTLAILRYRLWEVDVLINRTLVYGALTGALVVVYFGSVVLLQALLFGEGSGVAVAATTLALAALFQPLRRRVQEIIDRRFYRRKYKAARALGVFTAQVRDEVDLGRLTRDLAQVVGETLQPAHISLWLRDPGERR